MRRTNTADLWLERLQASWLQHPWERWAARILGASVISIVTVAVTMSMQLAVGLAFAPSMMTALLLVAYIWLLTRSLRVHPVEALGWSWRRAFRWLPVTLTFTLVGATLVSARLFFLGPASGMDAADARMLLTGNASVGVVLGIAVAIVLAIVPGDRETRVRPNEGIAQSLRNGLLIAIPSALVVAAALAFVVIPYGVGAFVELRGAFVHPFPLAVRYAGGFGHLMFFVYGGAAVVLHWAIRLVIALRSPLPLRLVRFLDYAADLGLLRRVGGGYLFMHRTLLDHFADQSTPTSGRARHSESSTTKRTDQGRDRT